MRFEPGSKIGDYEVLGKLGAGGMGSVYKVRNELSDRVEAMKVLLPDLEGHADLGNRFLREIKVQAGLDHPNIAKLYTALRIDNQLLMCMELVEGITLDQRLREGPISLIDSLDYIVQVLSALDYAHQRGVVHRDIKPANMMLMSGGRIKLLDFGIAKASDNRLTVTGTTLGSLYYMSPEQIQGGQVDVRSDVYSVGVSLYELVTGKKPFDAESQFAIMSAHLARAPQPPLELNPNLPHAVSEIILMALAKDPSGRFQTAAEFLDSVRVVQEEVGYGTATMPVATPPPRSSLRMTSLPLPAAPRTDPPVVDAPLGDSLRMTAMQRSMAQPTATMASAPVPEAPPAEVAPPQGGSKKMIWIGAGAVVVLLAVVGIMKMGSKGTTEPTPFTVNEPSLGGGSAKPSAMPTGKSDARKQPPAQNAQTPPSGQSKPVAATPSAEPVQKPAPEPPPQAAPSGSLASSANKDRLDISQLSEKLDVIYGRAKGVRDSLQALPNPKPEWVESFNRLNQYLKQATAHINEGNPPAVQESLSKAAAELDGLEKALGR